MVKEAKLWSIDPLTAMQRSLSCRRYLLLSNLLKEFEIVAFSDGSWHAQNQKGGIGGIMFFKSLVVRYACSGPVKVCSAQETEMAACKLMWRIIGNFNECAHSLICVDSKNIIDIVDTLQAEEEGNNCQDTELLGLINHFPTIKIKYIYRKWNTVANNFAKQGRERENLIQG